MKYKVLVLLIVGILSIAATVLADGPDHRAAGDAQIFVTSQGLYYDTILLGELPQRGRFQKLEMGPDGPFTEFGPGDPGYLGGRWWVDVNGDNIQNEGDMFFLCPLLGPGHAG